MFGFFKRKTPAEQLRENKRMIDKAIRELDRERIGLQNQEKKLVVEIKNAAKEGHIVSTRFTGKTKPGGGKILIPRHHTSQDVANALAKSIVRNRNAVTKLYNLKAQLQAVSLRLAELKSTQSMSEAMRGTTKAMATMNKQLKLPALTKIMKEFMRQNEKMDMTSDMMGDAVDGIFEGEGEEEETDTLVQSVLDEIGVKTRAAVPDVPGQRVGAGVVESEGPAAIGLGSGGEGGGGRRPPQPPAPPAPPQPPAGGGGGMSIPAAVPPAAAATANNNDDMENDELAARLARLRGGS